MDLSRRITGLNGGGSDGWSLFLKARAMKATGIDVTELTIGEHDISTDPSILDALHGAALNGHTGYAAISGTRELRAAIANRVTDRTGVPTHPDNVLVTPGGQAALFAAHMAVCDPGDTGLFIDPYYATYPGTIRAAGAIPLPVAADPAQGFQPTPDALDRGVASATGTPRSLLINSPNNPTGVIYTADTLHGIAQTCLSRDLWLISDEVYDTQIWQGRHISPRTLPDMADRTLVIGSMSKSHAMTGSRVGWIVGPENAIAHMTDLSVNTTYGVPGYIQDAVLFALKEGAAFEEKIAAPFRRRRDIATRLLADTNAVSAVPSDGAMYIMLDIRATGLSGEGFAIQLLDRCRIAVMPGESFGTAAVGHVRVAMTVADDRFAAALSSLVGFAEELSLENRDKRPISGAVGQEMR